MNIKTSTPARIDIQLDIHWDSTNTPHFTYAPQLPWVHSDGTLDLTTVPSDVQLTISLISHGQEKFASPAIGIVPLQATTPELCPAASIAGHGVFHGMVVSSDRRTLTLIDNNQGKAQFFYALWFIKPGMGSFAWDPIIINK